MEELILVVDLDELNAIMDKQLLQLSKFVRVDIWISTQNTP